MTVGAARFHDAARVLATAWMPDVEPVFVRAFSNCVYRLPSTPRPRYLRITAASHRSEAELESELDFVRFLGGRGLAVSEPVLSRAARLVHAADVDGETFYACVFEEAPGCPFTELSPDEKRTSLRLAGRAMGRLHAEGQGYAPPGNFQRSPWWEDRWSRFAALVPEREREAWQLFEELQAWTRTLPRDPAVFGLIHGDFTILNMRFLPERVTLFDFDSCGEHWYGYELATFLHYFGGQDAASRRQAYDDVLDGYTETAAPDARTLAALPLFGKMRLLYSFLVFAEEWGFEGLSPEQEAYFALRRRLFGEAPTWS
jgi:amicoumacin kinase